MNYTRLKNTAQKMLKGNGQLLTLTTRTTGLYDVSTGAAVVTTTTQTAYGAIFDYGTKQIDGTLIKTGDKQLMLSALNSAGAALTAPKLGDTVTGLIDGVSKTFTIYEPLKTIAPAGTIVMFECNLRGA